MSVERTAILRIYCGGNAVSFAVRQRCLRGERERQYGGKQQTHGKGTAEHQETFLQTAACLDGAASEGILGVAEKA
jgi:hypothetical protein